MGSSIRELMTRGAEPPPEGASLEYRPSIGEVMQQGPSIGDLMGRRSSNLRPEVTGLVDPGLLPPEEPGILGQLWEMVKETGLDLVQTGKYVLNTPGFNPAMPILEGRVLEDATLASQGDPDAQERLRRGMRGAAFAASTAVGGIASGAFKPLVGKAAGAFLSKATLKKGAAWLAAEELGASVYSSLTPLDEGRTRAEEFAYNAVAFPVAGAVFHGLAKAGGAIWKRFKGLRNVPPKVASTLNGMSEGEVKDVAKRIEVILGDVGDVPPQSEALVHSEALAQAVREQRGEALRRQTRPGQRRLPSGPEPRPTTVTARVVEQEVGPTEADFRVETSTPLKEELGAVSERELQQELETLVPGAKKAVDEEAAARARVEEARTTPFPGADIPPGITPDPLTTTIAEAARNPGAMAEAAVKNEVADRVVREVPATDLMDPPTLAKTKGPIPDPITDPIEIRLQQLKDRVARGEPLPERTPLPEVVDVDKTFAFGEFTKRVLAAQKESRLGPVESLSLRGKLSAPKLTNEMVEAWWSGDATQIANTYLDAFGGNAVRAEKAMSEHGTFVLGASKDGMEFSNGNFNPSEVYSLQHRSKGALAALSGTDLEEVIRRVPPESYMESIRRDVQEGFNNAYYDTMGALKDERPPLTNQGAPPFHPGDGPQVREGWGGLSDANLEKLKKSMENFWGSQEGAISYQAARQLAGASLSGLSFWSAEQTDDPKARAALNMVGAVLAAGTLMSSSATRKWFIDSKFGYSVIKALDAARVFSDGTLKGARDYQEIVQGATMKAVELGEKLRPHFREELHKVRGMFSFDEGRAAPEWALLTPDQQSEIISLGTLVSTIGRQLKANGLIKDIRADFIAHLFHDNETRLLWTKQWEDLAKTNAAAARVFATLRSAEAWAKVANREAPLMDPLKAMPAYVSRANKMLANDGLRKGFQRTGMLRDYDPSVILTSSASPTARRDVWRQVKIPNLGATKMAPDEVATLLERAAYAGSESEFIKTLDSAKGHLMRSIMVWPWEHGVNVWRGVLALDGTGSMYREWYRRIEAADPQIKEISRHVNLFQRPDFGFEAQNKFDVMLEKIGAASPTLKKLGIWVEDKRAIGERKLWDRQVPALGAAVWSKEMDAWTKRTGGRYGIGSAEYEAAARKAGDMANFAMGKVPDLMASPRVMQALRLALFSPNWTRGRIALTMGALGEATKIASGEISVNEASYMAYKLRGVLVGVALTTVGSLLLTGNVPQFNPNTLKFYMRTGVKDKNGREIGVDLAGWWQDDVKLMNDPIAFYRDRQNPMIREFNTQIFGRDIFGRPIATMGERLESLIQMTGPPGEAASLIASVGGHLARGEGFKEVFSPANLIRDVSGLAAVGNVSALPKSSDALVNKYATKLLRDSGLPNDKDRVYELSQLMKRNRAQGGSGFSGEVETYIAIQQRQYRKHDIAWIWQQGKRALQNLTR